MKNLLGLIVVLFVVSIGGMIAIGVGLQDDYIIKVEKREPNDVDFESIYKDPTLFFASIDKVVRDRFPFRGTFIGEKAELDFKLLGRGDYDAVYRGRSEWLFYKQDDLGSIRTQNQIDRIVSILGNLEKWHISQGRAFRFVVAPSKQFLYPEFLPSSGRRVESFGGDLFERIRPRTSESFPNLLDQLATVKESGLHAALYYKEDTHHTFTGAMVMAKAIVNSLKDGIWQSDAVYLKGVHNQLGDLARMIGLSSLVRPVDVLGVKRPGVSLSVEPLSEESFWDSPTRYRAEAQKEVPLIPGRSLIFHDSFIGSFLREPLAQYFEDVTFVHYRECNQPRWREMVSECDTVVYEVVARELPNLSRMLERKSSGGLSVRLGESEGDFGDYGGFVDRIYYDATKERLMIEGWVGYDEIEDYLCLVLSGVGDSHKFPSRLTVEQYERPDVVQFLKVLDGVSSTGYRIVLDGRFDADAISAIRERISVTLVSGSGKKNLLRNRTN